MRLATIAEANRRDFLKRSAGAIAGAATGTTPLAGLVNLGTSDPFSDISDEELISTPESEWIDKIPYQRLLKLLSKEFDSYMWGHTKYQYGGAELGTKLAKIAQYGADYKDAGKVGKILVKALKDSGRDMRELSDQVLKQTRWSVRADQEFAPAGINVVSNPGSDELVSVDDIARQHVEIANKLGLNLPYGKTKSNYTRFYNGTSQQLANRKQDKQDKQDKQEQPEERIEAPSDYSVASPMHQWFESRLQSALNLIQ